MKFQDLSKFELPPNFRGASKFKVQLWWLVRDTIFRLSPQFCYKWRNFLLRLFGAKIGKNVIIRPTVNVTYPWKLRIGDNSWIGDNVDLYTLGKIKIGKNTVISQRSYLCTGTHDYQSESFDIKAIPITVGDEVWIATDVFVAPGSNIGSGSVVGARSSVFNDIPQNLICLGSPAQPIKQRESVHTCSALTQQEMPIRGQRTAAPPKA